MNGNLDRKVAIVTGGGTGIGAATGAILAEAGMRVVLVGRRAEMLDQQVARIREAGGEAMAMTADVREFGQVADVVARTIAHHGRLDVFVANAAVADPCSPIDQADPAIWADIITTNVLGVLYSTRAALPAMLTQGWGHIVIMSSVSGRVTYVGEPAYIASKHATVAFADCLRQEVASKGIRVAVIEPGAVETPLAYAYPGSMDMLPDVTPLDPDDVARAVRYIVEQPEHCNVLEVVLRPTRQVL